jgi:hypothetical protein
VHRTELHLRRVDVLELVAVVVDRQTQSLEVLEEGLDRVGLRGAEERVHDAVAVAMELRDLGGADQRSGGRAGGNHGGKMQHLDGKSTVAVG